MSGAVIPRGALLRDEGGASSVEFALVAALFLTAVLAIVDFARAMWVWNMAAAATQAGARHAVVSDIAALGLDSFNGAAAGAALGEPVPVGTAGTEHVSCTSAGCGAPGGFDPAAFAAIVAAMQRVYDSIQPENVVVEYRHLGLGMAGNPAGPHLDLAVTVRLTGLRFGFVTPGLAGFLTIDLPGFAATLTGEDQETG